MATPLPAAKRINTARLLLMAETFEQFIHKKFPSYRRFSGEGLDSQSPCLHTLLETHHKLKGNSAVISAAHRGRLTYQVSVCNYPLRPLFHSLRDHPIFPAELNEEFYYFLEEDPMGYSSVFQRPELSGYRATITAITSSLEIIGGVGIGKTRCKQDEGERSMHVWIHGDAALSGEGVVYEIAQMAKLKGYSVGGTVHMVANNQLGFTTEGHQGRSSQWTTDIFKIIQAPIVHINSLASDEIVKVAQLAVEYRERFNNDFVIDLIGYRRYGHNEHDEPGITNPHMYKLIREQMKGSFEPYSKRLLEEKVISQKVIDNMKKNIQGILEKEFEESKTYEPTMQELTNERTQGISAFRGKWSGFSPIHNDNQIDSGYSLEALQQIARTSVTVPEEIKVHPIVKRGHIDSRLKAIDEGKIDWSTAETLAFGSLMEQGYNIRMSGQDVMRGTFTQRHAGIVCQDTEKVYYPLSSLKPGKLHLYNSLLSEMGVVAFEYGYAWESPNNLVLWEAQFGDFANCAQPIFDLYVTSGESKWIWQNGMVFLLPHGQEGAGPDHCSARIERVLQQVNDPLSTQVNIEVINSIIPSNYFHALRRQMLRNFRRPIIMATPKSGLRHKLCISSLEDFAPGTSFQPAFLKNINQGSDKTLIFCSGKVYLDILTNFPDDNYSIVLVEQLAPFPSKEIQEILQQKSGVENVYWVQEEPLNSGAWHYMKDLLRDITGKQVGVISRPGLSAGATGNGEDYKRETEELLSSIKALFS